VVLRVSSLKENAMRISVAILSLVLAATPALADYPNHPSKNPPAKHELRKAKPKTTVNPAPAPNPDPSAGSGSYGAPTGAASNGGEQGY
jgi:hypothetical protein